MWWSEMMPTKCSISGATLPARVLRLIWAGLISGGSGGSGSGSAGFKLGRGGSSSAAMIRKTLEAHLCPLWYFSSHEKHRPRSQREATSSGDRRFTGGGVRGGAVSKGAGAVEIGVGKGGGKGVGSYVQDSWV